MCIYNIQWRAETVGCPGPTMILDALEFFSNKFLTTNFLFVSQNLWRPFLVVQQKFSNSSPNISVDLFLLIKFYPNFPLFRIGSRKFAPWIPPTVLHYAPVTTFFSSFISHLPTFFRKLAYWMPPGWMPGAVAPSAPPLHANSLTLTYPQDAQLD